MDPEKLKELKDLQHKLDDKLNRLIEIREDPAYSWSIPSYVPVSTGFTKPKRTIPLKEDSEYTLDDLRNMLSTIINIAKSNGESEEDIVNMLVDALDEI